MQLRHPIRAFAFGMLLLLAQVRHGFAEPPEPNAQPPEPIDAESPRPGDDAARLEFFEKRVRPVLATHCYNCHSANTNSKGGLRVDDREGMIVGGDRGPAVVPGKPEASLLLTALEHKLPKLKMPPTGPLPAEQVADLAAWIRDGAVWPQPVLEESLVESDPGDEKLRREHWSWQPLRRTQPAVLANPHWGRNSIDAYILSGLEARGLAPVDDADPRILIRRITLDLTGLPPTAEVTDAFVAQCASGNQAVDPQEAIARLVDQLLASPAFGEHWGRHWLDVARYGESTGSSRNVPYPHAWRYRDYVVDALNTDKPYDRFLIEQIAGDLLPASSPEQRNAHLVATGFLALGPRDVNQRFKVRFIMDNVDEQIDTVTRAVLGLTVSCARCHDHKFDPIPTADYYALAGIFRSTDLCAGVRNKMGGGGMDYYDTAMLLRLEGSETPAGGLAEKLAQTKAALAVAESELAALRKSGAAAESTSEQENELVEVRERVKKLRNELAAIGDPAAGGSVALGVRDSKSVADTQIRIRGEAEQLGPVVPRGVLTLFEVPDAAPINPRQSGRLELAQWLASPRNPLTARVMANRVWHHLFGRGLVASVDNFGVTGDTPSHPELLDHLATRLIDEQWSIKKLIRAIVLSRTYQLSSATTPDHLSVDPANRLQWRHAPRRLTAEEIRDAMLLASGALNPGVPPGSPAKEMKVMEINNNGNEAKQLREAALASRRRSIYLPLLRGLTPRSLEVFDFAEQGMVTGSRDSTTVATQALYLLNDPFVQNQAQQLADQLVQAKELDQAGRVTRAYRSALGRDPTASEIERVRAYIETYRPAVREAKIAGGNPGRAAWCSVCQALLASAEFRYVR